MDDELIIDESNFNEYFFDIRFNKPKKGQIMARFRAQADFVEGKGKRDLMDLLKQDKAYQACQVMKKIHGAKEPDCYRICREIAEDLLVMPPEEVETKPYTYLLEYFYYTKREYVPQDKHWETLGMLEYDEEKKTFKSVIQ